MIKRSILMGVVVVLSLVAAVPAFAGGPPPGLPGGDRAHPVIYVTGQELYYDSIVGPELPMRGRFQKLEVDGSGQLYTEFGPGDQGFVGGRWWVDMNGDNMMNDGDKFFSCPLLGPGRDTP